MPQLSIIRAYVVLPVLVLLLGRRRAGCGCQPCSQVADVRVLVLYSDCGELNRLVVSWRCNFFDEHRPNNRRLQVSAYVANLAAFLTQSMPTFIGTIDDAVTSGATICAHPAQRDELKVAWPSAKFVWCETCKDQAGLLDDYDAGKCKLLAMSHTGMIPNLKVMTGLCSRELVFTNSKLIEMPIAFPVRPDLAGGLSYWIHTAKMKHDITLESSKKKYDDQHTSDFTCTLDLTDYQVEASDTTQITLANLAFPFIFFASCALAASAVQLVHQWSLKKGNQTSYAARRSMLQNMCQNKTERRKTDEDDLDAKYGQGQLARARGGENRKSQMPSDRTDCEAQLNDVLQTFTSHSIARGCVSSDGGVLCDDFEENGGDDENNSTNLPSRVDISALSRFGEAGDSGTVDAALEALGDLFDYLHEMKSHQKQS